MAHMESPVTVKFPWMRLKTARYLALWADPARLQRAWVDRSEPVDFDDLGGQLGYLMDDFEIMPEFDDDLGDIIATTREVDRLAKVSAPLETMLPQPWFNWDDPQTFLTSELWAEVSRRSADLLQLLVLNGGCWDHSEPVTADDELVPDYQHRARLSGALASLAEGTIDTRGPQPPLWLPATEAGEIITRATAPEHWDRTRSTVLVDQHGETERIARVGRALSGGSDPADVPALARRALTAIVGNDGGWQYDHL